MTIADIREVVAAFAEGARRAREAGLDGVELHGANGYLITQFLSSAINDRTDEYGGSLENRARFVLDVVKAIRARVGRDFHLQMKISATEYNNALLRPEERGAGQHRAGVGAGLPVAGRGRRRRHPRVDRQLVPASAQPGRTGPATSICCRTPTSSWRRAAPTRFRNLLLFRNDVSGELFRKQWQDAGVPKDEIEGLTLPDAHIIKQAVAVPVICTGGFQTASVIRKAITAGTATRSASPGRSSPTTIWSNSSPPAAIKPSVRAPIATSASLHVVENPLGCYEESRFPSPEAMLQEVLSVFQPPAFV